MVGARYTKVIKLVREAEDLARSGALVLDDGVAAIYFLWGQPSHAYMQVGNDRVEGDEALKEIALALGKPGKVTWRSKDVLQVETLRCNAEDLVGVLQSMSTAGSVPPPPAAPEAPAPAPPVPPREWDGSERRRGPALRYSLTDFPLLPSGPTLWADVPTSVVHLDVLIGTLQNVMVVFEAPSVRAAGVVCDGERYDAIYIDSEGMKTGRVAWELMIAAREGSVSAYEIEADMARTLPVLWRNRVVHRDLDKTWINRNEFLAAQRGDAEDRAVIVATPDVIGIALFAQGRTVASYTTERRLPRQDLTDIQELLAEDDEGAVSVLERLSEDVSEAYKGRVLDESPLDEDEDLVAVAEAFSFQPIDDSFAPPAADPEAAVPGAEPFEQESPAAAADAAALAATPAEPDDHRTWDVADLSTEATAPGNGSAAAHGETTTPVEAVPTIAVDDDVDGVGDAETSVEAPQAEAAPPEAVQPLASLPFMAPGSGVGLGDFQSMLSGKSAGAPAPVEPAPRRNDDLLGAYEAPTRHLSDTVAPPEAVPEPPDFDTVVAELLKIGERFLGGNFSAVEALITEAPRTPAGLRGAISAIRQSAIPNQSADEVQAVARAMTLYVADRVSAM